MEDALDTTLTASKQTFAKERHENRVAVSVLGRFMLEDRQEHPCQAVDITPEQMSLIALQSGRIGEYIIAYLDHIGRVEGVIINHLDIGFTIKINASPRKKECYSAVLHWLANKDVPAIHEERRHERFLPKRQTYRIQLEDKSEYSCTIIDVSLSGAAIRTQIRPPIGTHLKLGCLRGKVTRIFAQGIAIEFLQIQKPEHLEQQLTE
ncbi:PilZ domain-containing protein [Polycladidibacter stylochi]|uniref:PilZ domain-containing protein n=1 Tax=Polycladidibacter stylochi TaxID=1807766 RepID=UPI00082BBDF2|nr:PilZ domain-containing protein [Pseudovibrio stylochi]